MTACHCPYMYTCLQAYCTYMCVFMRRWAHMTLCCHIWCYQGNPVVRRRSAERYMAWRRGTCGAQPVAGKKPVRDSPTNPVHFPCPWDELFLASEWQLGGLFHWRDGGDIFTTDLSVLLPPVWLFSFSVSKYRDKMKNWWVKKSSRQNNLMQVWRLFLSSKHFHSDKWGKTKHLNIVIWSFVFHLSFFITSNQGNV